MQTSNGYGDVTQGFRRGSARVVITSSTADNELVAAPGIGFKVCYSAHAISNYHASTTTEVHFKSASTIKTTHSAPFKGGNEKEWPHAIECAENEALNCATVDSIDRVTVSVSYFIKAITV